MVWGMGGHVAGASDCVGREGEIIGCPDALSPGNEAPRGCAMGVPALTCIMGYRLLPTRTPNTRVGMLPLGAAQGMVLSSF